MANDHDVIVVGGGHYGATIALEAARQGAKSVLLLERGPELLGRASWANQARVHMGYHYPRSFLTGIRSRVNFARFVDEFRDAIADDFAAYYAIARPFSKVTARQFDVFCRRIGAPIEPAPKPVGELFDADRIEAVFTVREVSFDALRLRNILSDALLDAGVDIRLRTTVDSAESDSSGGLILRGQSHDGQLLEWRGRRVFNCTYSRTNQLPRSAAAAAIPLRHELTEIALVDPPAAFENAAVTVMCGPFFSLTPFPATGCYALSHVRYTPLASWSEPLDGAWQDPREVLMAQRPESRFRHMVADAARYLPCIAETRYRSSNWEVKTILPRNDADDGRPILVRDHADLPGCTSVMGAKIDNAYDVLDMLWPERTQGVA